MTEHHAPRAMLFDLDGTLVDSLASVADAMAEAMAGHGFEIEPSEVIPRIGPPMDLLAEQITGCPPELADRMNEDFTRLYYGEYIQHTAPLPGAEDLLIRLVEAGVALGVVTNKVEWGGHRMLEVMGWADRFDVVVGRDTVARPKPAPDGALRALERLGAGVDEAGIVGDTEFDMQCGRDARLRWVVGLVGERDRHQLQGSGATLVVDALAEIAPHLLDGSGA